MSVDVGAAITGLSVVIADAVPFEVTVVAAPGEAPALMAEGKPYAILYPIPGGQTTGGMGGNQEQATVPVQIKIVGHRTDQVLAAQSMIREAVESSWASIQGLMGPPTFTSGGIVSDDQRTFNLDDTVYMEVSDQ